MRLDLYLSENGFCRSRSRAKELIVSGAVTVGGKTVLRPSYEVCDGDAVACDTSAQCRYVSRGGLKLERALVCFGISPEGLVCADIGASTGGFTDCLLQHGAAKVYAIDSGTAQLDISLASDPRVVSYENMNARYITSADIGGKCRLAVMDVSFISQTKLFPAVTEILEPDGVLISLIKPQFEVGRSGIGKGGIVKDAKKRLAAVDNVCRSAAEHGLVCRGTVLSPIMGGDGNTEYLACFVFTSGRSEDNEN